MLSVVGGMLEACMPPANLVSDRSAAPAITTSAANPDPYAQARLEMVAQTIQARGISDPDVLRAMRTVPRHQFVPSDYIDQAYEDHPLPIGYGQTISQPYVVAWMTELLKLRPGEKVLEIGTGSGYQAAILAELGGLEIYSIEIVPELAQSAAARLEATGYSQVKTKQGDGYYGWPEYAPFDAIIVTAAPDHLPAPLVAQLKEGGRLVIPIGPPGEYQTLWKFVNLSGQLTAYNIGGVSFVPFTGSGAPWAPTPSR
jgi:protein-L-isoaspartate(D-aspartate) O-methyltransferase